MSTQTLYNILWLDDDASIFNPLKIKLLEKKGISLLGHAGTGFEFQHLMEEYKGQYNAVVLDVNCDHIRQKLFNKKDTTGFSFAIAALNSVPDIPVFVYTGRPELLDSPNYQKGQLARLEMPAISKAGGLETLIKKIKEAVDERKTPEFLIKKQYKKELAAARLIPDAERKILEFLTQDLCCNLSSIQDKFNSMRKIIESIFSNCIDRNILPRTSLNGCASLLYKGNDREDFKMKGEGETLAHKSLGYSIKYCVDIIQDASHQVENGLSWGVDEYVRMTNNNGIFRSALNIVMEVLLWWEEIDKRYPCRIEPEVLWEDLRNYEAKSLVVYCAYSGSYKNVYAGKYQLNDPDHILNDGDIVNVISSRQPLTPNRYWPEGVTDFVIPGKWILVSSNSVSVE